MAILKKENNIFSIDIQLEETEIGEVKLSISNKELDLRLLVEGKNYHDSLWNLKFALYDKGIELICNGVSKNVYPTPMQFDMGLAYQGMYLKMGTKTTNSEIVNLIDDNTNIHINCTKEDQLFFYNKWILSKKKLFTKQQGIILESLDLKNEFLFFWGHRPNKDNLISKSCLSQWWPCNFEYDGITYTSAEQWMMAEKARIFSDTETLTKILNSNDQKLIKDLGRQIELFDDDVWNLRKYDVVYEGNLLKFSQNNSLKS
jgi:predicted NAD-dependent protein-ADP-ribosyltransferase YbiA (DUF1768 family)